jgi:hypothetical protein
MTTQTQTQSDVNVTMAEKMAQERWLLNQLALDRLTKATVSALAAHYKFDAEEALTMLGVTLQKAPKGVEKPKKRVPLPWIEARGGDMCQALDYKGGLFTQCESRTTGGGGQWCAKCAKNEQKYGTVAQRLAQGESFADPKGRAPTCYATILKVSGHTPEEARTEAATRGFKIPDSAFEPRAKKPRGKKVPAPTLTPEPSLDDVLEAEDPPATQPVVVVVAPVVVAPVAAKKPKKAAPVVDPLAPVLWEFRSTTYGKNALHTVFARENGQFGARVGVYDPLRDEILLDPEEDDEDDEEDE